MHYEFKEGIAVPLSAGLRTLDTGSKDKKGQAIILKMLQLSEASSGRSISVIKDVEGYYMFNYANRFVKLTDKENDINDSTLFPSGLFSGRGWIWNRTLPLLPEHILIGSGSGTFVTEFPQYYYVDKALYGNSNYDVKPHSIYLQFWVEEGLIALLCLIIFWFAPVGKLAVIMAKKKEWNAGLLFTSFMAVSVLTFLIAGLAGDSMLVHSPMFWTMLGMLYAGVKSRGAIWSKENGK